MSAFDPAMIGRRFDGPPFRVDAARIAAYAAATNDESLAARSGDVAPAVFAFVPLRPILRAMLAQTTPLYEELKGLHGEQDIVVHAPIVPGMTLTPSGSIIGLRRRSKGVAVVAKAESRGNNDELVNEHYITLYFPGASLDASLGEDAPDHVLPPDVAGREPDGVITQSVDDDQPLRYSEASGDTGAYHLDAEAARAVGLPGIIVHGMCTMAFAARVAVQYGGNGDPARLRRLAVRFARPVRPAETLATSIWRLNEGLLALETRNAAAEVVLANGRAELG